MSTNVLVVSSEPVGRTMAGPAIRALELARVLSRSCRVTLAAPAPSTCDDPGIELLEAGFRDFRPLLEAVRAHDVVVAQELPATMIERIRRLPVGLVVDLYNPILLEVLEGTAASEPREQRRTRERIRLRTVAMCAVADYVLCASERQRDLWIGALAMKGLIDAELYRHDPTLRSLIDVVPFGIPAQPPDAGGEPALKGARFGIESHDRVMLWAGGIWGWLDPATPIRAVPQLQGQGGAPATHLVFLGAGRPGLEATGQATYAQQAIDLARAEGLEGELVHFNEGWVPYAERGSWLAGSDIGVSAHLDHLETRFAFRTRILDYLWAGLPVVSTAGDSLGELIERQGLGRTPAAGDVDGFARACEQMLADTPARRDTLERVADIAPSLTWEAAAGPLVRWCADPEQRPGRAAPARLVHGATLGVYRHTASQTLAGEGAAGLMRQVGRRLRRMLPGG